MTHGFNVARAILLLGLLCWTTPASASGSTTGRAIVPMTADGPLKPAAARAAGIAVDLGPCTLYPSLIHLRGISKNHVGAKPYTKCRVPVAEIHQTTTLRYNWYLWWKLAGTSKPSDGTNVMRLTTKNFEIACRGNTMTTWAGTTEGSVVWRGKSFYARVYQPAVTLPCGA